MKNKDPKWRQQIAQMDHPVYHPTDQISSACYTVSGHVTDDSGERVYLVQGKASTPHGALKSAFKGELERQRQMRLRATRHTSGTK